MLRLLGNFLVNPTNLLFLLIAITGILYYFKYHKLWKVFAGIGVLWLLVITTSPIPHWLAASLEDEYPSFRLQDHSGLRSQKPHIIVLGAGFTNDTSLISTQQLSETVLGRLVEGYRIYRQLPQAKVITSGPRSNGVTSQGKMVARAAIELGVAPKDTAYLPNTYNTESEARHYAQRFPNQDTVIIATNALHMKRSLFWFRQHGKTPIPAPTNFIIKTDAYEPDPFFSVGLKHIDVMGKAMHEYAGLWYAKWKRN